MLKLFQEILGNYFNNKDKIEIDLIREGKLNFILRQHINGTEKDKH